MKKVGLFGGTFSPPHMGHRKALERFIASEGNTRTVVMPTYVPPHKVRRDSVSAQDRFAMAQIAFGDLPGVEVSDLEIRRGGKSYTALTLEELYRPGERLVFLCGTDMFLTVAEWYRPERIFELADLVCMPREEDEGALRALYEKQEVYRLEYGAITRILPFAPMEISSTRIRQALAAKDVARCKDWLSQGVWEYISEKGLYSEL